MNLLIMGPPGAGKGTQAEIISSKLGLRHLSSGDLLRSAVASGTELGKQADSFMKAGELVPDELMIAMILGEVQQVLGTQKYKGFLLDGFPRTLGQARALDKSFADNNVRLDRIISLNVDTEEIVARLTARRVCTVCNHTCNMSMISSSEGVCPSCKSPSLVKRKDDEESVIRNRLEVYQNSTLPIISYYSEDQSILSIDGSQEKDKITDFILGELYDASSRAVEV